jgi:hypothetical protein
MLLCLSRPQFPPEWFGSVFWMSEVYADWLPQPSTDANRNGVRAGLLLALRL